MPERHGGGDQPQPPAAVVAGSGDQRQVLIGVLKTIATTLCSSGRISTFSRKALPRKPAGVPFFPRPPGPRASLPRYLMESQAPRARYAILPVRGSRPGCRRFRDVRGYTAGGRRGILVHPLLFVVGFALILPVAFVLLSTRLGPRRPNPVKTEPYESGIIPMPAPERKFQVRFYLVAVSFLLFDVEIVFLFPWAVRFARWAGSGSGPC